MLESPVFITDARERWAFAALDAGGAAGPADGRPYFDAAFFWGPLWRARARDSVNVRTIRPEQADQQARIYLARRMSEAPLLVYRKGAPDARITRRVSPDGVRDPFDTAIRSAGFAVDFIAWRARPGSIIILHDGPDRGHRTARVLAHVLPALQHAGYRVVTLTELARTPGTLPARPAHCRSGRR